MCYNYGMEELDFAQALKNNDKQSMKRFLKADLHNHAVFSCDKKFLIENNIELPLDIKIENFSDFANFAHKYIQPLENDKNGLTILLKGTFEKCLESGVAVVDTNIGYKICMKVFDGDVSKFIKFLDKFKYKNLQVRWIIDISRDSFMDEHEELILNMIDSGFFAGVDLASTENCKPNNKFANIYAKANMKGLITKVHCGEQLGADYIKQCIIDFNPRQIQHGITIVDDEEIMKLAKERGIVFNICPTSNIILNHVKSYKSHPISKMVDFGLKVTIGSDDFLLFESDINDEYLKLYNNNVLSAERLDEIRKFSLTL